MKLNILKKVVIFVLMGLIYLNIETGFRAFSSLIKPSEKQAIVLQMEKPKPLALFGYTSLWMGIVGGLCGLFIGYMNEGKIPSKLSYRKQVLIGSGGVLLIEFLAGIFFNIILGFGIWDYSHLPLNILGQVSLLFYFFWVILTPFTMWVDDVIRFYLFKEEKPEKLLSYFTNLIKK